MKIAPAAFSSAMILLVRVRRLLHDVVILDLFRIGRCGRRLVCEPTWGGDDYYAFYRVYELEDCVDTGNNGTLPRTATTAARTPMAARQASGATLWMTTTTRRPTCAAAAALAVVPHNITRNEARSCAARAIALQRRVRAAFWGARFSSWGLEGAGGKGVKEERDCERRARDRRMTRPARPTSAATTRRITFGCSSPRRVGTCASPCAALAVPHVPEHLRERGRFRQ